MSRKTLASILMVLAAFLLAACSSTVSALDEAAVDEGAIYGAVLRQVYTVDHSFGEAPGWPVFYVKGQADDAATGFGDGEPLPPDTISPEVRDAVSEAIADLPTELKWVDSESDAPPVLVEPGAYAGGEAALVTLGSIHENEDGTVYVSFWLHCGSLCGIGMTYVLEFVDGAWVVTGTTGPMIMS